jgi:hypothetical protein
MSEWLADTHHSGAFSRPPHIAPPKSPITYLLNDDVLLRYSLQWHGRAACPKGKYGLRLVQKAEAEMQQSVARVRVVRTNESSLRLL